VRRIRGFTLTEMVIVLVMAGILAAVVIPQFSPQQTNASWFYEQVKSGVRYAQRQAVAQRRTVYVVMNASTVSLCYDSGCSSPVNNFATGAAYTLTAPSGVTLAPLTFSFNGLGQPSAAPTFAVGGSTITVTAETGYVR